MCIVDPSPNLPLVLEVANLKRDVKTQAARPPHKSGLDFRADRASLQLRLFSKIEAVYHCNYAAIARISGLALVPTTVPACAIGSL